MKLTGIIATCTTAAVLATGGVAIAGATSAPEAAPTAQTQGVVRRAAAGGLRVAAEVIGISPAALAKELRAGKSIADVATAKGKDPQAVIDALVAAGTKRINAAKDAGKISDERAERALDRLPERMTDAVNGERPNRKHAKHGPRVRRLGRAAIRTAADTIDIQPRVLTKELRAGKTIADVATANDTDPQAVIDAIVAAGTTRINEAKDAGKLSDEQAAKRLEKLPGRVTTFVNKWTPKKK